MDNNIKKLRKKKDILQIKLAIDLGLTQETISSYETGKVTPSTDILIKMADYFHTNIDYILCRTNYDLPINELKPDNISENQFEILTKFKKLSNVDQARVDGYLNALIDKKNN